jgi:type VI secretion system secreted protein VgrG
VRVADTWAGANFGFIQVPRIGQEVMVEFMEGDPDRPVITGRVYNTNHMPPWKLPEQKTLSGIQSREFKAARKNQLVLDDTQGQIQAQLSSDHGLSQLNLGYITRVEHVEGRKEFRGEGFELRTDGWGVVRADKGLYVSTDPRKGERHHQKDIKEADNYIKGAVSQHRETVDLAKKHNAQDSKIDGDIVAEALKQQHEDIHGTGEKHGELAGPQMVFSSPAGITLTTMKSAHTHSAENTAITTGRHLSFSTGHSILGSAIERISLFAHRLGMRLFAGKGKVEIQAQSDDIEMIAEKVVTIISAKKSIQLTAAEEIVLVANGSYLRINGHGIEQGTKGKWAVYAGSRAVYGPKEMNAPLPNLPSGSIEFDDTFRIVDKSTGEPVKDMRYELHFDDGGIVSGVTGEDGVIPKQDRLNPAKVAVKLLGKKE